MTTRRVHFDPADPHDLQPEQRWREIAAIVAAGVIRMRAKRRAGPRIADARRAAASSSQEL